MDVSEDMVGRVRLMYEANAAKAADLMPVGPVLVPGGIFQYKGSRLKELLAAAAVEVGKRLDAARAELAAYRAIPGNPLIDSQYKRQEQAASGEVDSYTRELKLLGLMSEGVQDGAYYCFGKDELNWLAYRL